MEKILFFLFYIAFLIYFFINNFWNYNQKIIELIIALLLLFIFLFHKIPQKYRENYINSVAIVIAISIFFGTNAIAVSESKDFFKQINEVNCLFADSIILSPTSTHPVSYSLRRYWTEPYLEKTHIHLLQNETSLTRVSILNAILDMEASNELMNEKIKLLDRSKQLEKEKAVNNALKITSTDPVFDQLMKGIEIKINEFHNETVNLAKTSIKSSILCTN